MLLINGVEKEQWPVYDRAFQYGDGCFTTILVKFGEIQHWQAHLSRLQRDSKILGIQGLDWKKLLQALAKATQTLSDKPRAVIKILLSRGIGGRGYSPAGCNNPTVIISTHPYPAQYLVWQQQGIRLSLLKQRLGLSSLAGVKHLNRLEQVLSKQELIQLNTDDGVSCCINGNIVETTAANIFWRQANLLYTPNLSLAGVLGTKRYWVINVAKQLGLEVKEVFSKPEVLFEADEIFICNALMEVVSVRALENVSFKDSSLCNTIMSRLV